MNTPKNPLSRKKFFGMLGIGATAAILLKINPFSKAVNGGNAAGKLKVEINPLAVERKKTGTQNG